jgi:O-antigen/teichoic acid export membrane protein
MKMFFIALIVLGIMCTFGGTFARLENWQYANICMIAGQVVQWIGVIGLCAVIVQTRKNRKAEG